MYATSYLLPMPTKVDSYLTGKAAAVWPGALVVRVDEHAFFLRRPGLEDLELGVTLTAARKSLYAVIEHAKQEKKPAVE